MCPRLRGLASMVCDRPCRVFREAKPNVSNAPYLRRLFPPPPYGLRGDHPTTAPSTAVQHAPPPMRQLERDRGVQCAGAFSCGPSVETVHQHASTSPRSRAGMPRIDGDFPIVAV